MIMLHVNLNTSHVNVKPTLEEAQRDLLSLFKLM